MYSGDAWGPQSCCSNRVKVEFKNKHSGSLKAVTEKSALSLFCIALNSSDKAVLILRRSMADKKKQENYGCLQLLCQEGVDVCDCVHGVCVCLVSEALYFPNCSQSGNPPAVSAQALVPGMQFPGT